MGKTRQGEKRPRMAFSIFGKAHTDPMYVLLPSADIGQVVNWTRPFQPPPLRPTCTCRTSTIMVARCPLLHGCCEGGRVSEGERVRWSIENV